MRKTTKYILFLALIALLSGVVSAQPLPATLDIHNDVIVSEDSGTADFIVELSNPSIFLVTVDYASADGTAMAGIDYTATSDTLTFAPGTITLGPEVYNIWVNEIGGDMAVIAIQQGVTVLGQFAPSATTGAATGVSNAGATLNGIVNAKGSSTTVTFEYGTDAGYGTTVTADQSPVTGSTDTAVSKTIGGLAPDTTYHYRVVVVNAVGTTNGVDITFTTLPHTPPQRGGGGGYTSIASVDRWSQGIGAGENVTLSFDETAITRIVVTAETDIPDLMISTHQATRPGSVPAPNGTVVGYVELTLYKVTDAAIRGVVIEFAVPISWLAENGFEPEQVVLLRWQDGEWQELPTNYVREDTGTAYFLAESPGLSLFAISAMEKSIPAQDTIAAEGTVAPGIGTTTVPETDLPLATEPMVAEPTAPGEPATPQTPLQYAPLLAPLVIPLLRRGKR